MCYGHRFLDPESISSSTTEESGGLTSDALTMKIVQNLGGIVTIVPEELKDLEKPVSSPALVEDTHTYDATPEVETMTNPEELMMMAMLPQGLEEVSTVVRTV